MILDYMINDDVTVFMYRRPILCTLYGAVDFLNVLKKYIMYLQVAWEEVLVRNVLHYVPVLLPNHHL